MQSMGSREEIGEKKDQKTKRDWNWGDQEEEFPKGVSVEEYHMTQRTCKGRTNN